MTLSYAVEPDPRWLDKRITKIDDTMRAGFAKVDRLIVAVSFLADELGAIKAKQALAAMPAAAPSPTPPRSPLFVAGCAAVILLFVAAIAACGIHFSRS